MPLGVLVSYGASVLSGGLLTKCVDWLRSRERTAVNVMHAEIGRLNERIAALETEVRVIRDEKHDLLDKLFAERMETFLLRHEVNEELRRQGQPLRYDLRTGVNVNDVENKVLPL
jgi:outer membrane murein-binding lipoprotein Lpp